MEFFNQLELDSFANLKKQPYHKANPDHRKLGLTLKNSGVYAKTRYWAGLLKEKGYEIGISDRWQMSGYFSSYTWAKIMLPGILNRKVFFTVGVGSRLIKSNKHEGYLEYKLDCQRSNSDRIDSSMEYLFDKYIRENCDPARSIIIYLKDIDNWDNLVELTLEFLRTYQQNYITVADLTYISKTNLPKRFVRLCWNNNNWQYPSGQEGKSKAKDHTFEKDKGYGYEEWLFNPTFEYGGYRYGFIQAFHKGGHHGKSYEVSAYAMKSINGSNTCYWIGKFNRIDVLTLEEQDEAITEFKRRGWMDQMRDDLRSVGVQDFNFQPIDAGEILNVRYKIDPDNWVQYPGPLKIENSKEELGGNHHYVLHDKKGRTSIDEMPVGTFIFRAGHNDTKDGTVTGKRSQVDYLMRLRHKDIQLSIYNQLMLSFLGSLIEVGTENITNYGMSIDLVVRCPNNGITFYEIKTCGSALQCIREAIGQLFEYSYYSKNQFAQRLVIVGLNEANGTVKEYMQHIRQLTGRNVYYQFYDGKKQTLASNFC